MATHPSTNGWTVDMLLAKIRARLYMSNEGADHHRPGKDKKAATAPSTAMRVNKFKPRFSENQKSIRQNLRNGSYSRRDNPRAKKFYGNKGYADTDERSRPHRSNAARPSYKKKFFGGGNPK